MAATKNPTPYIIFMMASKSFGAISVILWPWPKLVWVIQSRFPGIELTKHQHCKIIARYMQIWRTEEFL